MFKKNDRVELSGRKGTVIGNSYRVYNKGSFAEVLFDGDMYIETVSIDGLVKTGE